MKNRRRSWGGQDGFRCTITGLFDRPQLRDNGELRPGHGATDGSSCPLRVAIEECHADLNEPGMQGVGVGEKRIAANELHTVVESSVTIYSLY